MKNSRMMHGLLWGAVVSALTVLPAYADTAGVNAILEAAAGKATVPAPAVPSAQTPSVQKPVSSTPTPTVKTPQDALIGPVAHVAPTVQHPAVTVPVQPVMPPPSAIKPAVLVPHPVSPAAMQVLSHPVTPLTTPPLPMPAAAERSQAARHAVTDGYINPFMGTPGTVQKLSNTLSILQIQTQIAKARADYAKYDSEADNLAMDGSPQLRKLEATVEDLRGKMQALATHEAQAQQSADAVQAEKKSARPQFQVVAIMDDRGERSAIIHEGKTTHTVFAGGTLNGQVVQAVEVDKVILGDGKILRLSKQVGHYASTSWKGHQSSGDIASPQQSGILDHLAAEAKKAGIRFNAPPPAGATSPSGMPVLSPGMIPG